MDKIKCQGMYHLKIGDFKLILYLPFKNIFQIKTKIARGKNCKINLNINNSSFSTTNINTLHITRHNNMSLHDDPTTLIIFPFYIKYKSINLILT